MEVKERLTFLVSRNLLQLWSIFRIDWLKLLYPQHSYPLRGINGERYVYWNFEFKER